MQPDPTVLAFDTSAAHCAAALLSGDHVLRAETRKMAKGQAEALMPMLQEMLTDANVGWQDLTRLGVGIGPGNFTGIRISVSAARGLALGLNLPAVGVSTLEALAEGHQGPSIALCDARRSAVYAQGFNGIDLAPQQLSAEELHDLRAKHPDAPLIGSDMDDGVSTQAPKMPLAVAIARIAARSAKPNLKPPAPLYLRAADAAPAKLAATLLDK
ncbi:MAG: tRNA (adenosine(37)-N6)-threonylcarbamoyltransferase complex dimerization subunit type 1 TsaB [Pseudomonadota bacterium]